MNLRQYAEACTGTFGLLHQANLRALRLYIKQTEVDILAKEIKNLTDPASLRAVWEAGVPKQVQQVYFDRLREVM